jgi:hypothetical protein
LVIPPGKRPKLNQQFDSGLNRLLPSEQLSGNVGRIVQVGRIYITPTEEKPGGLKLEVQVDGFPFDSLRFDPPKPTAAVEDVSISGWRMQVFHHLSDKLCYRGAGGRTPLTWNFSVRQPVQP